MTQVVVSASIGGNVLVNMEHAQIAALKAMLIAADARDLRKDERIERLEKLVAAFKTCCFWATIGEE